MDSPARSWRSALVETVRRVWPSGGNGGGGGVVLVLSGGYDSTTLAAALLAAELRPRFALSYRYGASATRLATEMTIARRVADRLGVEHRIVDLPLDRVEDIRRNVARLVALLGDVVLHRATAVQCAYPFLTLFDSSVIGESGPGRPALMLGTGGIVLDGRRIAVAAKRPGNDTIVRRMREVSMADRYNPVTGTGAIHALARSLSVELIEPYSEEPVRSVGLSIDYDEMQRPFPKGIALRAFNDFFAEIGRPVRSPLQVGSGLRDHHARLLAGRSDASANSVAAVYRRFAREAAILQKDTHIDAPHLVGHHRDLVAS